VSKLAKLAERWDLRAVVAILVILIPGIFIKLDQTWLATLFAVVLCLILALQTRQPGNRSGPGEAGK
jgi:hypothetical protein